MLLLAIPVAGSAATSGSVLWQRTVHMDDGAFWANQVQAAGNRVFVAGEQVVGDASNHQQDARIVAMSAKTGQVLWDDTFDRNGGYEFVSDMIVTGNHVVIVGGAQDGPNGDVDAFVSCYDAASGALLWTSFYDRPGMNGEDAAIAVDVLQNRIVIAGQSQGATEFDFDVLIQSYDLTNGMLLWSSTVDFDGKFDAASDVTIAGSNAIVTGFVTGADGYYDALVAGYDVQTGAPVWSTTFDDGGSGRGNAITSAGGIAYVGGELFGPGGDTDMLVRAFDGTSGSVLWTDLYDAYGHSDAAWDIAVRGGVVVAAGEGRPEAFSPDVLTRAFDAATGQVLWTDLYDVGVDRASAVAITDGKAVVAGSVYATDSDWLVRTLDLADGSVVWQDRYDRAAGSDSASAVTASGNTVYVVGFTQEAGTGSPGSHSDLLIRAYAR